MMRPIRAYVSLTAALPVGSSAHHTVDNAGVERPGSAQRPFNRLLGPGIHGAVENDITDACRQRIALHRISVLESIDGSDLQSSMT